MAKPAPYNPAEQHNIIGKDTVIEGTLRSSGNIHISGTVNGNVEVQGRTVVMPDGKIEGEVNSTTAEVGGRIMGHLIVKERLVLKATAVVEGDIRTSKLVIEDGATFTGRCDMSGTGSSSRPGTSESAKDGKADKRTVRHLGGSPDGKREAAQA